MLCDMPLGAASVTYELFSHNLDPKRTPPGDARVEQHHFPAADVAIL